MVTPIRFPNKAKSSIRTGTKEMKLRDLKPEEARNGENENGSWRKGRY